MLKIITAQALHMFHILKVGLRANSLLHDLTLCIKSTRPVLLYMPVYGTAWRWSPRVLPPLSTAQSWVVVAISQIHYACMLSANYGLFPSIQRQDFLSVIFKLAINMLNDQKEKSHILYQNAKLSEKKPSIITIL